MTSGPADEAKSLAVCVEKRYAGGMKISVSIKPCAKKDDINQVDAKSYRVSLKAAPADGKANRALILLIANYFGVAQSRVEILSGASLRKKIIEIR